MDRLIGYLYGENNDFSPEDKNFNDILRRFLKYGRYPDVEEFIN